MTPRNDHTRNCLDNLPINSTDPDTTNLMDKFDAALMRRRSRSPFISEERREQLREDFCTIIAHPDAEASIKLIRSIRDNQVYQAVAGNFAEFITDFLCREQGEVEQQLNKPKDSSLSTELVPAEPGDAVPGYSVPMPPVATEEGRCEAVALRTDTAPNTALTVQQESMPVRSAVPIEVEVVEAELVTEGTPAFWASRINKHVAGSVRSLLDAGRDLIAAKATLPHGKFTAMFASGLLTMGQRTAEKLMLVAGNRTLANTTNCSYLPHALNSLVSLAAMDEKSLQLAIDDHRVKPKMTIVQTKALVSGLVKPKKERKKKTAPAGKPRVQVAPLSDYGTPEHSDAFSRIGATLDEELWKCPTQAWKKKLMNRVIGYLQGIRGTK